MKKLLGSALALVVLSPTLAFAGGATNAALGLGAFAVFNQMLSGVGIFGGLAPGPVVAAPVVVAPPPVVITRPAPVVYAPAPPVVYAPAPVVYAPAPVVYAPAPVFVAPRGGYYAPAPIYRHAPRPVHVSRGWCPPGHARQGRCY